MKAFVFEHDPPTRDQVSSGPPDFPYPTPGDMSAQATIVAVRRSRQGHAPGADEARAWTVRSADLDAVAEAMTMLLAGFHAETLDRADSFTRTSFFVGWPVIAGASLTGAETSRVRIALARAISAKGLTEQVLSAADAVEEEREHRSVEKAAFVASVARGEGRFRLQWEEWKPPSGLEPEAIMSNPYVVLTEDLPEDAGAEVAEAYLAGALAVMEKESLKGESARPEVLSAARTAADAAQERLDAIERSERPQAI